MLRFGVIVARLRTTDRHFHGNNVSPVRNVFTYPKVGPWTWDYRWESGSSVYKTIWVVLGLILNR